MAAPTWNSANGAILPQNTANLTSLTIEAPPETDIWRRTDTDDVFTAPIIYQSMKASSFKSITATVFAGWKTQYDQGGLILSFPNPQQTNENDTPQPIKWIKAGIELYNLSAMLGVVGTDRYSDWSLSPMSQEHHQKATIKFVREGTTLWVYAGQAGSEKLLPMRELKWAFMEGREEAEVWVGVYAAKPTPEEGDENESVKGIEVEFSDLKVERVEEE